MRRASRYFACASDSKPDSSRGRDREVALFETNWARKLAKSVGNGCRLLLVSQRPSPMVENGTSNKNLLRVRRVVDVPLREVSGICLRQTIIP